MRWYWSNIVDGDDFISLSVGEEQDNKNDCRQMRRRKERERFKENRKRKRSAYESDNEEEDGGIDAFPWLDMMPDSVPGPLNVDKL